MFLTVLQRERTGEGMKKNDLLIINNTIIKPGTYKKEEWVTGTIGPIRFIVALDKPIEKMKKPWWKFWG